MNQPTSISLAGLEKLKQHEGVRQVVYLDAVGKPTVGVGHLIKKGEPYKVGQKISMEEVDKLLKKDLAWVYTAVGRNVKVKLTQNKFDSLVSLVFNIGEPNFKTSTVLRELNRGNYEAAADAFLKFNRGGGKILKGLSKRRAAEKSYFMSAVEFVENNPGTTSAAGVVFFGVGLLAFYLLSDNS
jgi:lysozyme